MSEITCETQGHLWGSNGLCVMCKQARMIPARPDAATWAKELEEIKARDAAMGQLDRLEVTREVVGQLLRDRRALLTLHAQAVAAVQDELDTLRGAYSDLHDGYGLRTLEEKVAQAVREEREALIEEVEMLGCSCADAKHKKWNVPMGCCPHEIAEMLRARGPQEGP